MRLVISSLPKGRARTRTPRSESGLPQAVLKFGHALVGGRKGGGRDMPEPEASQIEGTKTRVDGAERRTQRKAGTVKERGSGSGGGWREGVKSSVTALDESSYRLLRAAVEVKLTASEGWVFTGVARLPSCPPASLRNFFPRNIKFHGRGTIHPTLPPTPERKGARAGGGVRSVCRRAALVPA